MLREFNEVKRFLGTKFGMGENVPDGVYAIPTKTSKGNAFMNFLIILVSKAPQMYEAIKDVLSLFDGNGIANIEWIRNRLHDAIS